VGTSHLCHVSHNWNRRYRWATRSEPHIAEQSKTVDTALSLLTLLAGGDEPPTAASLARRLGASRTAVARMLTTLESHRLARRTDRGWAPGLGLLALAAGVEPRLRGLARAELEQLALRFGETAVLTVREGDEAVAVDQVVGGTGVVQIHYPTGTRHPVAVAASGRALLAENVAAGVVFSEGELEPGVRGVAAPVIGAAGRPVASVALVAPRHRFPADAPVAEAVRDAAARVSRGLAHPDRRAAGRPPLEGDRHAVLPQGR
jgi:DNA-binding IclR family transcriptional regulator